jgi:hypothetical protein
VGISPPRGFRTSTSSSCIGPLVPGKPVQFVLKTAPYDRNLTIVLSPRVELRSIEGGSNGS